MRNMILGSFLGFLLAAAFLAACGGAGDGGVSQATFGELERRPAPG